MLLWQRTKHRRGDTMHSCSPLFPGGSDRRGDHCGWSCSTWGEGRRSLLTGATYIRSNHVFLHFQPHQSNCSPNWEPHAYETVHMANSEIMISCLRPQSPHPGQRSLHLPFSQQWTPCHSQPHRASVPGSKDAKPALWKLPLHCYRKRSKRYSSLTLCSV